MPIIRDIEFILFAAGTAGLYLVTGDLAVMAAYWGGFTIALIMGRALMIAQSQRSAEILREQDGVIEALRVGLTGQTGHTDDQVVMHPHAPPGFIGRNLSVEANAEIKGWRISFPDARDQQGDPWRVTVERDGSGRCTCGEDLDVPTEPRLGPAFALLHLANQHTEHGIGFDEAVAVADNLWATMNFPPDPPGGE